MRWANIHVAPPPRLQHPGSVPDAFVPIYAPLHGDKNAEPKHESMGNPMSCWHGRVLHGVDLSLFMKAPLSLVPGVYVCLWRYSAKLFTDNMALSMDRRIVLIWLAVVGVTCGRSVRNPGLQLQLSQTGLDYGNVYDVGHLRLICPTGTVYT